MTVKRAWERLLAFIGWPVEGSEDEHPEVRRARERVAEATARAERVKRNSPMVSREDFEWFRKSMDDCFGSHRISETINTHTTDIRDGEYVTDTTTTRRNGVAVTCRACQQKNTVWFDRQGHRRCGACGLPIALVRYRGAR